MSLLSREIVKMMPKYSMQNFHKFALAILTPNLTDISIYPTLSCRKKYARGRSSLISDTEISGDVTFIARNRHTGAYIFNANFTQFCVSYIDEN